MKVARGLVIAACVSLGACAVERTPHLYPLAGTGGVVSMDMLGHGQGFGTLNATLPSGERLQGEYSIVFNSSVSFGSVFASVYGGGEIGSANAMTTGFAMSGEGYGSASLVGDKGTSIQCEFKNNNLTGHGYGACKRADGEIYRMIY
jgi:hypothetical protein